MDLDVEPDWLSTADAAARLGLTSRTIYRLIDSGELVAYKFGRVIRVKDADLARYIETARIVPGELGLSGQTLRAVPFAGGV